MPDAVLESQRALVESAEQTSAVIALLFYFSAFIVVMFSTLFGFGIFSMRRNQITWESRESRLEKKFGELLFKHEELHNWIRTSWTENQILVRQTGEALERIAVSSGEQVKAFAEMDRSNRQLYESISTLMRNVQEVLDREAQTHKQLRDMPCVVACKDSDRSKSGKKPGVDRSGYP